MPTQPLFPPIVSAINHRSRPLDLRPREPCPAGSDLQPCFMAGVDPVIVQQIVRFNPLWQRNLILVDGAVTAPNLTELARRGFLTTAIVDDEPFLTALDLEMDRWLEFPHQRERMQYRRGTPGQIPLSAPHHDGVVMGLNIPFSRQLVAEALHECRRVLRPAFVMGVPWRIRCTSTVALTAPRPKHRHGSRLTPTPGLDTPLNDRGETICDLQPLVEQAGFSFTDPCQPIGAVNNPPRYVLWLDACVQPTE